VRPVPTTAAEWFQRGLDEIELSYGADTGSEYRGDLEGAVKAFEQVLALEPNHEEAPLLRARMLAKLGEHEAALDGLVAAAARSPQDLEVTRAAAASQFRLGQLEQALASADQVLAQRPDDGELLYYRASALTQLGRAEAVAACELLLGKPELQAKVMVFSLTTRLKLLRGLALAQAKDPRAFAALRETFETEAGHLGGPMTPPEFFEVLGRFDVARIAYTAFVESRATTSSWKGAISVWLQAKRPDEALAASERLIELTPTDSRAWFDRAEALVAAGQREAAIAAFERSLEFEPGFLGAQARLKVVRSA
jgi:tetratricopeptide (TPR) repeat protein